MGDVVFKIYPDIVGLVKKIDIINCSSFVGGLNVEGIIILRFMPK